MPSRLRKIIIRLASFLVAGGLLYLALRGVNLEAVWASLKHADYRWAIPAIVVTLGSHLLRAWRWQILLNALPASDSAGENRSRVSLDASFSSLMIGYMVNYLAPRMGEVARTANVARRERLSFSSVLGTVVVERVLDIVLLLCGLVSVGVLLAEQLQTVYSLFFEPVVQFIAQVSLFWIFGGLIAVLLVSVSAGYWYLYHHRNTQITSLWQEYITPLFAAFRDGWNTLFHTPQRVRLVIATVGMWFGYLMMAYLPFVMLDMADVYSLSLVDTWAIMILGTLGILVPLPGGTGSYHYVTIQTLVYLFAVNEAAAASYAVLTHAGQMLLYLLVGGLFLLREGVSWKKLKNRSAEVSPSPGSREKPSDIPA